jgi:hypothetical protein
MFRLLPWSVRMDWRRSIVVLIVTNMDVTGVVIMIASDLTGFRVSVGIVAEATRQLCA